LAEEYSNFQFVAEIQFALISVLIEQNELDQARRHFTRLETLHHQEANRYISQYYRIAEVLLLKTSARVRDRSRAEVLLTQILAEDIVDHGLTNVALLNLCELLLGEFQVSGSPEVFEEVEALVNRLLVIAQEQNSWWLYIEVYLIQSKLVLVELDLGRAQKLLERAWSLAKEKGLLQLGLIVAQEQALLQSQTQKWKRVIQQKPSAQELLAQTGLEEYIRGVIHKTVTQLNTDDRLPRQATPKRQYTLVYRDLLKGTGKGEHATFRVGIAQIGVSHTGDILHDFFIPPTDGLFTLKDEKVEPIQSTLRHMVELAHSKEVSLLVFPDLMIDLTQMPLHETLLRLAKTYQMYIIPGAYHDAIAKQNLAYVISPIEVLWKQDKHLPDTFRYRNERIIEGITSTIPQPETIIAQTELGRIAIINGRDFLDLDLRVELKHFAPNVDLIINTAFTPRTADFEAAHFDARRSIYAYCLFANVAEFGNSFIMSPEKTRDIPMLPPREEGLIVKDIDLFELRAERRKWETLAAQTRPFIQSTR
jgi:predicted amidohydrolase